MPQWHQFSLSSRQVASGEFPRARFGRPKRLGAVPRFRQIHPLRLERFITAAAEMKDLPKGRRVPALLLEQLRERDHIRQLVAHQCRVVGHASLVRSQAGQERRAARIADRILHIGPLEAHAAFRQPVDVRRLHRRVAVTAERVAQIIHGDEQNVRPLSGKHVIRGEQKAYCGEEFHRVLSNIASGTGVSFHRLQPDDAISPIGDRRASTLPA